MGSKAKGLTRAGQRRTRLSAKAAQVVVAFAVPDEGLAARRAEALAIAVHVDIRQLLHHSALPAPRPAARDVTQPHARSGRVPNFAPVEGNHAERRAFVLFD